MKIVIVYATSTEPELVSGMFDTIPSAIEWLTLIQKKFEEVDLTATAVETPIEDDF